MRNHTRARLVQQLHKGDQNYHQSNLFETSVESLESRCMLAGNVSAIVTNSGDLRVFGDAGDNDVAIHATGNDGEFFLEGLGGTTINGQASVTLDGIDDDIRVVLRGGNDRLLITAAYEGGAGAKAINFIDDISVNSGGGDDTIFIDGVTSEGNIGVVTGGGDDSVSFVLAFADNIGVFTGGGDDTVGFSGINRVSESTLVITGGGDDIVAFSGESTGSLATTFEGGVTLLLGGGDDSVGVDGGRFQGPTVVIGGGGADSLQVADAVNDFPPINLGIEDFGEDANSVFVEGLSRASAQVGLGIWLAEGLGQFV